MYGLQLLILDQYQFIAYKTLITVSYRGEMRIGVLLLTFSET
jgi:hypothetical protein